MEKLTRLYKIMYGSMDSLFVSRREDYKRDGQSPQSKTIPGSTANSSKLNGYSSMTDLSQHPPASKSATHHHHPHKVQVPLIRTEAPSEPKLNQWPEEVMSTNSGADTDSCYSDSYSISYRTVNVLSDFSRHNQNQHQQAQNRNPRLSPFASRALSQSSQSLPVAVANAQAASKSTPHKGSFSDLQAIKNQKQKKSKLSKPETKQQACSSTNELSTNTNKELKINSVKDLIEVLIYQLQVMERSQAQLNMQSQNMERANKVYQQKLEIAARETELLKQKLAMLETEVWRCYLCSRDKVQLYSADICVVSLICGHLLCAECSSTSRTDCPKCGYQFTIDRRIHL